MEEELRREFARRVRIYYPGPRTGFTFARLHLGQRGGFVGDWVTFAQLGSMHIHSGVSAIPKNRTKGFSPPCALIARRALSKSRACTYSPLPFPSPLGRGRSFIPATRTARRNFSARLW